MDCEEKIYFYYLLIGRRGSFFYKCRDFANRCKGKLGMWDAKREICGLKGEGIHQYFMLLVVKYDRFHAKPIKTL